MKAGEVKGLAVVSIADGAKLGKVEDVLFEPGSMRAAAVLISQEGQQAVVPFDQVRVGSDAVTIPSREAPQWASGQPATAGRIGLSQFESLKVVDMAGTFLGKLDKAEIDPQSGDVVRFDAHKGGVLGVGGARVTIAADDVVSVGDELVVIRNGEPQSAVAPAG